MTTFIDLVTVDVAAGRGGDGCVSFRREKFVPRGGPNGGDGGKGGDVVVQASKDLGTLIDLHYRRKYHAGNGEHGKGKSQKGSDGKDTTILVPCGTVVKDTDSGRICCELLEDGERFVVARGGKGGIGNERFATPRNRAPRKFTCGEPGEEKQLELTLKLIADVGLVGEPNAGKSTLLSTVSAAHPKIAPYPFTTKKPVLGVVRLEEYKSFVMVDIPGLIEGAHEGKGMGKDFLRHIERCRVLVYLVDVTVPEPAESYASLRNEILYYDPAILEKRSLIALTKCDLLPGGIRGVDPSLLSLHQKVVPISSVSREGLDELIRAIGSALG
ncbi:MAG: GTPase ObgE [Candidatus Latescibacteria bacterium]|nr:GTPase ObgE [Candidatus Latescibacterota bacterium]NIM20994.1 GTPase ObgE [Candidatus Latescibacterota bacterium]NIM65129.1 GTPase ObgE [Candidatus Latescibacterota bacterium]NIO01644.1 GTPase ObgE [Candidatus Latescibacterota bacterium]NIO28161.1 GTPase ObgE [Candidatus Latescibacterota bacterium]